MDLKDCGDAEMNALTVECSVRCTGISSILPYKQIGSQTAFVIKLEWIWELCVLEVETS